VGSLTILADAYGNRTVRGESAGGHAGIHRVVRTDGRWQGRPIPSDKRVRSEIHAVNLQSEGAAVGRRGTGKHPYGFKDVLHSVRPDGSADAGDAVPAALAGIRAVAAGGDVAEVTCRGVAVVIPVPVDAVQLCLAIVGEQAVSNG